MSREINTEIVRLRNLLREKYDSWKKLDKSGLEHLPDKPNPDEINKIKEALEEELKLLDNITVCCTELTRKLNEDWSKL